MGAEGSVLKGCKLDDPLESPAHSRQQDWVIHPARRDDGSQVSVFVHKGDKKSQDTRLQNAAKQLKVLRHPTILKFFASCNNVEGTYLITEQVKPLDLVLENLSSEEICVGMFNVIEALSFLHTRGGVSHNNVCTASIYVSSQDGGWRLGGMEHLCKFEDATVQFLKDSRPLRHSEAIPPEENEDALTSNAPSVGHARDAYAFGILAEQLLQYLEELGDITSSFVERLSAFIDPEPKNRPQLRTLLQDHIFRNDFLEIINFLNHLTLKSEQEKDIFFEDLAHRLHRLPAKLVAVRLAPMLLSSFVMAEPVAVDKLFVHLLTPKSDCQPSVFNPDVCPIIHEELFKEHLLPLLSDAFQLRDSHVRCVLLRHFSSYVHLFDNHLLRSKILIQLLVGLKDTNDEIVSATFHALANVVPILGAEIVVGGERYKYFVERRPKFHTKKENGMLQQNQVGNLTAVSGVIGLPLIEKIVTTNSRTNDASPKNEGIDEEKRKLARDEERQRKRDEIRRNNEKRKKEREQKRLLNKQNALGKSVSDKDLPLAVDEPPEIVTETVSSPHHSDSSGYNVKLSETEDNDWSDWEDMDNDSKAQNFDSHKDRVNSTAYMKQAKDNSCEKPISDNTSSPTSILNSSTQNFNNRTERKGALKLQTGKNVSKPKTEKKSLRMQELGQEFAVPDFTPKPEQQEFDFFADMQPTFGKTLKTDLSQDKSDDKKTSTEQKNSKFKFQMEHTATLDDDAGWGSGDDLNWDFDD
ncbi:protein-associating with the carboxyl-terminal domain of ezrin-like [Anneissia japonica]|uniref:protein-associating with the carboxyl-terminal domain of ezrin-like n=1 Tax=Anneissia japonica TaxID=1529436 RepID=UPI001425B19B|nr:protein-associating with the carboxyl-terminal domain of ezrin-like [Anneissia japonica]